MNVFQNLAGRFLEKEHESRHELHQLAPKRIISDHGLHPPSRGYGAVGGSHGFVIHQTISPGDPAAAGPLESPQPKSWMATGMVPPDNN